LDCLNDSHELSGDSAARLDEIIKNNGGAKGSLIEVLHRTQDAFGFLPSCVQAYIAGKMRLPVNQVHGIVTFYNYFTETPRGKHVIRVCLGTACYVREGNKVLESLEKRLGVSVGCTTNDQRFSLEVVRCVGACALSPVVMIDNEIHKRMTSDKVPEVLSQY
jgi:NADH:ubiquinone oxidoreductase subunit E